MNKLQQLIKTATAANWNVPQTQEVWRSNKTLADLCDPDTILELCTMLQQAEEALTTLSCLGNGDQRGNSIGNDIAYEALTAIQKWKEQK